VTIPCGNSAPHTCVEAKCLFCGDPFCRIRDGSWSPTNPYCSPICAYNGSIGVSLMNPFTRHEWARRNIARLDRKLKDMDP